MITIETLDFEKMNGLIPAIIQDEKDGTVLMLGFMNKEALQRTIQEQQVVFWSRTNNKLWKKGETSGNYLNVVSIDKDCDNDTLLIRVQPEGTVCHTGERSCFPSTTEVKKQSVLQELIAIINQRKEQLPEKSYTTTLFRGGVSAIGQKVGEEAVELAIAAQYPNKQRCIEETADLFFHTLVLLAAKEISFSEIEAELQKRMKK